MSCEHWRERIIDSLASELTEVEEALLAEHVASCPACASEARVVRELLHGTTSGLEWRENPATRARLLAALQSRRPGARMRVRDLCGALGSALSRPVPAYAAILLVALGLFLGLSVKPTPDAPPARHATAPASGGEPSSESRRPLGERRFEVTGADAVLTRGALPGDSL